MLPAYGLIFYKSTRVYSLLLIKQYVFIVPGVLKKKLNM